jgi:hypothetical protein
MKQWTCGYAVENMWRSLWENVRRRALTLAETTPRIVDRLDEDEELPVVREPDEQ